MDGLGRAVGDGISGLVGGSVRAIGAALDGMIGALGAALPPGALPIVAIALLLLGVWLVIKR